MLSKIKCVLLFGQFFLFFNCIGQDNSELIERTILRFYSEYVKNFQNVENRNIDSVRMKFSTECLINKLSSVELDFDPYINAQDCDSTLVKTLKVRFRRNNIALIQYGEGKYRYKILMKLVFSEDKWLIDGLKLGRKFKLGCW